MRRQLASVTFALVATSLVATVPSAAGEDRRHRQWPSTACRVKPSARPTLLTAYFDGRRDGVRWRYEEAHDALEASGISTEVLERNGPTRWDGFAQAGGTGGDLVPAGRRLRNYEPPRKGLLRPIVGFDCAGHHSNLPDFAIQIPRSMHARTIVERHGGRERRIRRMFAYEDTRWWSMRRAPRTGVVQRMLVYLRDDDVYTVEMERLYSVHSRP